MQKAVGLGNTCYLLHSKGNFCHNSEFRNLTLIICRC